jgi:hypothetical protein
MQEHFGENRKKQQSYTAALCDRTQTVTPHHSPEWGETHSTAAGTAFSGNCGL